MEKHMEELTEKNYDQTIKKGLHLVDFWAPWCGPCKMQTPILEELEKEYTEAELQISKVNIDEYPEIARRYGIQSIPTMLILRDGQLVKQIVGVHVQPQLKKELSIYMTTI
jgi:thioredoxin 1